MKKILLIEDNADVRENTAEILELAKYNVITAENGKIGVDLAMKEKPDLIIFTGDLVNERAQEVVPFLNIFNLCLL